MGKWRWHFREVYREAPAQAEGLTDGRLYANSRDPGKRERLRAHSGQRAPEQVRAGDHGLTEGPPTSDQ